MRRFGINYMIYFYMFICLTLLFFNIAYIFYQKRRQNIQEIRAMHWKKELAGLWKESDCTGQAFKEQHEPDCTRQAFKEQHEPGCEGQAFKVHKRRLRRKLKRIDQLIAYNSVMEDCLGTGGVSDYLEECYEDFLFLAVEYGNREAMERAFFAYVISLYYPYMGTPRKQMVNILLKYMDDATVYCRENVLLALYAIGDAVAVEHAFMYLDSRGLYHSPKLISDGLMTYKGDKEELARRLWSKRNAWNESLVLSVIQFVTQLDADFSEEFIGELQKDNTSLEHRFAYIRYFQRHVKPGLKGYLIDCLKQYDASNNSLAIVISLALGSYPGEDTALALEGALQSKSWYVRKNAAASLLRIGLPEDELRRVYEASDRYGKEILEYVSERRFDTV